MASRNMHPDICKKRNGCDVAVKLSSGRHWIGWYRRRQSGGWDIVVGQSPIGYQKIELRGIRSDHHFDVIDPDSDQNKTSIIKHNSFLPRIDVFYWFEAFWRFEISIIYLSIFSSSERVGFIPAIFNYRSTSGMLMLCVTIT